jgi:hypothetical protein
VKSGNPASNRVGEVRTIAVSDWDSVVGAFHELFADLGDVVEDGDGIGFRSRPADVATGLSLGKDGGLAASMPLHGMQATVHTLRFDESRRWVELVGDAVSYTYRIPDALLVHRQ